MSHDAQLGSVGAAPGTASPPPQKGSATGDRSLDCCGKPMEPQLVRARDRSGGELFVAVWYCERCGRIVY